MGRGVQPVQFGPMNLAPGVASQPYSGVVQAHQNLCKLNTLRVRVGVASPFKTFAKTNMMSTTKDNSYWQNGAQDKKVPLTRLRTGTGKESDSAASLGTSGESSSTGNHLDTPLDQQNPGPGLQENPKRVTKNKRNYTQTKWSIEEKKIILYCFNYSRYESWGRKKTQMFESMLKNSKLPQDKLSGTTTGKLTSLVSVLDRVFTEEERNKIRKEAHDQACQDFQNRDEEDKNSYSASSWTREEKWALLWAKEYAKVKHKNQIEGSKEWKRIFFHHCPNKRNFAANKLNSQKHNIISSNIFSLEMLQQMRIEIDELIEEDGCPLRKQILPPLIENPNNRTYAEIARTPPQPKENKPRTPASPPRRPRNPLRRPQHPPTIHPSPALPPENNQQVSSRPPSPPDSPSSSSSSSDSGDGESPRRPPNREQPNSGQPNASEQRELEENLSNRIEEIKTMNMKDRPKLIKLRNNRKLKDLIYMVNLALGRLFTVVPDITELNAINYGAALFIQETILPPRNSIRNRPARAGIRRPGPPKIPGWKRKLTEKITLHRAEISQMTIFSSGTNTGRNLRIKILKIKRKYNIIGDDLSGKIAELKAIIKGMAAEVRNRERKEEERRINREFDQNPRTVYSKLMGDSIEVVTPPGTEELEGFWRPLFEDDQQHQENDWTAHIETTNQLKPAMNPMNISLDSFNRKLAKYSNFKAPGIDKLPNYWIKALTPLHTHYVLFFDRIIRGNDPTPEWLTTGCTTLLPKSQQTNVPSKYRPITCLSTTYKLLTGLTADAIYAHLDHGNYLEGEQKGCIREQMGTKDQLLINKAILEDCKKRQRNLSMAWIDYSKAFDSVPHSWIVKCLRLYKINEQIIKMIENQMRNWKTNIVLNYNRGRVQIENVKINRGIFQGDSLSPLLFCLAINPLSVLLNKEELGYSLEKTRSKRSRKLISHLLFMDDLKVYANNEANLKKLMEVVKRFSKDIGMKFGLDKCSKCSIKKGRKVEGGDIPTEQGPILDLASDSTYKYLGVEENSSIEQELMREKLEKDYLMRVKKVCKTELTPKNKITAINQLAIPVLTYGFGIIDWPQYKIDQLDIKTRKILSRNKVIYRNQCHDRIYLPRRMGGLGLTEVNQSHRSTIVSLGQYLISSSDPLLRQILPHHTDTLTERTSLTKLARNFARDIIVNEQETNQMPATKIARKTRGRYSKSELDIKKERWKENRRAGKFLEELEKDYIDKERSLRWLKNGTVGFDGERILIGAQDQGLMTNGFKKMAGLSQNDQCRFCHNGVESTSHLLSNCEILLADGHYTARHNRVCRYLHHRICSHYSLPVESKVWLHEPKPVTANDQVTVFYDHIIRPGRFIENNAIKPDIVVWDKLKRDALIIDVSVPSDYGLNRAERDKVSKYLPLKNDLMSTWNLSSAEVIPVIVGATGLQKKNLTKYLEEIPGKPDPYEVQLSAIKGSITILKRALGHRTS